MFNIDVDRLITMLLSPRLLSGAIVSLLTSILEPIRTMVSAMISYRNDVVKRLSYNAQVCSLERMLNDKFDSQLKRIYINDMSSVNMLVAYEDEYTVERIILGEDSEIDLYPVIASDYIEIGDNTHRFVVNIPDESQFHSIEAQLIALTNRFKLSGKTFLIRYF